MTNEIEINGKKVTTQFNNCFKLSCGLYLENNTSKKNCSKHLGTDEDIRLSKHGVTFAYSISFKSVWLQMPLFQQRVQDISHLFHCFSNLIGICVSVLKMKNDCLNTFQIIKTALMTDCCIIYTTCILQYLFFHIIILLPECIRVKFSKKVLERSWSEIRTSMNQKCLDKLEQYRRICIAD